MNPANWTLHRTQRRFLSNSCFKLLVASVLSLCGNPSHAAVLHSPRGEETFNTPLSVVVPPPARTVRIEWEFPPSLETPDLVFVVYRSNNLDVPVAEWNRMTNVPGKLRSVEVSADAASGFFAVTASNFLGESDFATR